MEGIPIRQIHVSRKEPDLPGNFNILHIGDLLAGKDMVQDLHRHDFFFVLTLEKGAGEHVIDFNHHKVDDHSVFFMRPGQVHRLKLKAGSTGYLMQFTPDFYVPRDKSLRQLLQKASAKNLYRPEDESFKKVLSALTYIYREHSDKQERYRDAITAGLSMFFIELARQNKDPGYLTDSRLLYKQEQLEEFLRLLEINISDHKQVSEYAAMLHISPYRLNAITKATLGKTCLEVINEQIILESKRYLLATPSQVKEIAYHLGYEDVSYFIRFFKKHTGYSPEVFRNHYA